MISPQHFRLWTGFMSTEEIKILKTQDRHVKVELKVVSYIWKENFVGWKKKRNER